MYINSPPRPEIKTGLWWYKPILNPMDLLNKVKSELEKKGYDFWEAVYDHYEIGTDLPELPNNE